MSRSKAARGAKSRKPPGKATAPIHRTPGPRGGWIGGVVTVAAVAAVAAVVVVAVAVWRRPGPDPLGHLPAAAAAESARVMFEAHRFYEAVPYARRVSRLAPLDFDFHARFAATLNNAAIQGRVRDGIPIPCTRSSVERMGLLHDAIAELDRAEQAATDEEARCSAAASRAEMLAVWGFARESYAEYRRANEIHPLAARSLSEATWLESTLDNPVRADLAPGGLEPPGAR